MTHLWSHIPIGKYHLLELTLEFALVVDKPDNKQNHCGTGEECECEELRRGPPLACVVTYFASTSGDQVFS